MSIRRTLALAGIAIIDTGGAQSKRLYPIADHLGSTIAIADSSGHLVQGLAYADFGKRYSAGWGAALTTAQALAVNTTLSDRGYSGQESLDAIGLDDYNARLYDPSLGRFLSVDPLIGHPGSTQGINPYSYVANNPLNKTDPTGEVIDNCYTPYCERHHLGSFGPIIFYGTTSNMDVATHITSSAGPNAPSVQAKRLSRLDQTGQGETPSNTKTNPNMHDYNGRKSDATGTGQSAGNNKWGYTNTGNKSHGTAENKLNDKSAVNGGVYISDKIIVVKGGSYNERKSINDMLHKIGKTPRGKQLFEQALRNGMIISVRINHSGVLSDTGIKIEIDPTAHPKIDTIEELRPIPATTIRILAHELGHAITGLGDTGPNELTNIIENENPIATHLNPPEPARISYGLPYQGNGG